MLNIKTVKNLLITDESKDGFCFRSSCSQTLKTSQLATEMADWNSSFTEADYLGMLSVMETIVTKYLAKGYNVTLPFGTLRANAYIINLRIKNCFFDLQSTYLLS